MSPMSGHQNHGLADPNSHYNIQNMHRFDDSNDPYTYHPLPSPQQPFRQKESYYAHRQLTGVRDVNPVTMNQECPSIHSEPSRYLVHAAGEVAVNQYKRASSMPPPSSNQSSVPTGTSFVVRTRNNDSENWYNQYSTHRTPRSVATTIKSEPQYSRYSFHEENGGCEEEEAMVPHPLQPPPVRRILLASNDHRDSLTSRGKPIMMGLNPPQQLGNINGTNANLMPQEYSSTTDSTTAHKVQNTTSNCTSQNMMVPTLCNDVNFDEKPYLSSNYDDTMEESSEYTFSTYERNKEEKNENLTQAEFFLTLPRLPTGNGAAASFNHYPQTTTDHRTQVFQNQQHQSQKMHTNQQQPLQLDRPTRASILDSNREHLPRSQPPLKQFMYSSPDQRNQVLQSQRARTHDRNAIPHHSFRQQSVHDHNDLLLTAPLSSEYGVPERPETELTHYYFQPSIYTSSKSAHPNMKQMMTHEVNPSSSISYANTNGTTSVLRPISPAAAFSASQINQQRHALQRQRLVEQKNRMLVMEFEMYKQARQQYNERELQHAAHNERGFFIVPKEESNIQLNYELQNYESHNATPNNRYFNTSASFPDDRELQKIRFPLGNQNLNDGPLLAMKKNGNVHFGGVTTSQSSDMDSKSESKAYPDKYLGQKVQPSIEQSLSNEHSLLHSLQAAEPKKTSGSMHVNKLGMKLHESRRNDDMLNETKNVDDSLKQKITPTVVESRQILTSPNSPNGMMMKESTPAATAEESTERQDEYEAACMLQFLYRKVAAEDRHISSQSSAKVTSNMAEHRYNHYETVHQENVDPQTVKQQPVSGKAKVKVKDVSKSHSRPSEAIPNFPDLQNQVPPWEDLMIDNNAFFTINDRDELYMRDSIGKDAKNKAVIYKDGSVDSFNVSAALREQVRSTIDPSFDSLLIAMAQMTSCELTIEDQASGIISYKNLPLGFKGLACRHCGGRPGSGRYFPSSIRSLSQTTTAQNMIKHFANACVVLPEAQTEKDCGNLVDSEENGETSTKPESLIKPKPSQKEDCTNCPYTVWLWITEFQRRIGDKKEIDSIPNSNEGNTSCGARQRVKYGARKLFYSRVWQRMSLLHNMDSDQRTRDRVECISVDGNSSSETDKDENQYEDPSTLNIVTKTTASTEESYLSSSDDNCEEIPLQYEQQLDMKRRKLV